MTFPCCVGATLWHDPRVRSSLALLAVLAVSSACESTTTQADPAPIEAPVERPDVDRGMILTRPATPLSASPALEIPEEPAPEQVRPEEELTSLDGLDAAVRERLPEHRLACARVKRLPCRMLGDLDGDGAKDIVALVEPDGSRMLGLAVLWAHGGVDLLGAGRRGQKWLMQRDGTAEREPIPADLSTVGRWGVWSADGPEGARRGFVDRKRHVRAAAVRGDGILLEGGDLAPTIAYHDGKGWRLQYLEPLKP